MKLPVVIVNWNAREETLGVLQNLSSVKEPELLLVVVDNGSKDGSADAVVEAFSQVVLLRNQENLGFAAAANQGLRRALEENPDFLFLLNNDARVQPETLVELLAAAERRPEAGLFGGRIYADAGLERLWCCGVRLGGWFNLCRLRGFGKQATGRFQEEELVDSLTGCGLLVRRGVLQDIGFFDESFWVYVEDADFCLRARAAGHGCLYVPKACLVHAGGGSTGGGYAPARKYLTAYGSALLIKKHGSRERWLLMSFLLLDLLGLPLLLAVSFFRGRLKGAWFKARGLADGLLGRPVWRDVVNH